MDASRARRKVIIDSQHQKTYTCSAETVLNCIYNHHSSTQSDQGQNPNYGVYLFHVHPSTQYLLPSPINEAVGVFHMKAYVINDALILSGANLSEEYFVNRHDRYLVFTHGANGLVDFYADLIELLCDYSERYNQDESLAQNSLSQWEVKLKRPFIRNTTLLKLDNENYFINYYLCFNLIRPMVTITTIMTMPLPVLYRQFISLED